MFAGSCLLVVFLSRLQPRIATGFFPENFPPETKFGNICRQKFLPAPGPLQEVTPTPCLAANCFNTFVPPGRCVLCLTLIPSIVFYAITAQEPVGLRHPKFKGLRRGRRWIIIWKIQFQSQTTVKVMLNISSVIFSHTGFWTPGLWTRSKRCNRSLS